MRSDSSRDNQEANDTKGLPETVVGKGLGAHVRLLAGLPAGTVAVSEAGRGLGLIAVLARSALLLPDGLLLGSVLRLRMRGHLCLRLSQHLDLQRLHSHSFV